MMKLLVVDDNEQNRYMLQVLLSKNGFDVELASNGVEALERARAALPELIISDILMPTMDGFTLCRTWMQDEHLKTIPFVFYTATYTTARDEELALSLGAARFIVKPLEPEKFLALLRETIADHTAGKLAASRQPIEDTQYYKKYNATLIRKLEDKLLQLEDTNRALELDIAERKRIEEQLQASLEEKQVLLEALRVLNDELELRVSQRTADLERANKELNEFAYIVSHDLKAPLRGIKRLAHWLHKDYADVLDEPAQEQLDLLAEQVGRMDRLIDGVLGYSRATRGPECVEAIDLNTLLSQIIESLLPPEHIAIRLEETLPVIYGDPIRLTQVFQNLVSNAIKFMDKLAGEITISFEDAGTTWIFRVEDNGPGIEPRHHERIFQIFQSCTSEEAGDNTGIGLTVVKRIVEFYGGHIWVESTLGQGSRFFFTWPKHLKEAETPPSAKDR